LVELLGADAAGCEVGLGLVDRRTAALEEVGDAACQLYVAHRAAAPPLHRSGPAEPTDRRDWHR